MDLRVAIYATAPRRVGTWIPDKPTLVTGGGAREFMLDEETALVSPDGDARSLAENLERVLTDATLREKIRAGGTAKARQYSLGRMEQELLAFADSF